MSKLKNMIKESMMNPYKVCKPTQNQVKKLFKLINKEIFDGELESFYKTVINKKLPVGTLAQCDCLEYADNSRACILRMKTKYDNKLIFLETIIHEMVHSYQWLCELRENINHGRTFLYWQKKILKKWSIKI